MNLYAPQKASAKLWFSFDILEETKLLWSELIDLIFEGGFFTSDEPTGWFETGQDADIVLSAIDFNDTGGPLLFNHPGAVVTDGEHLLLADTFNNRILIWNTLPTSNTEPDLVLGQENFTTNNPGTGLDQLNWPTSVATDGQRVLVTDTENDRVLVWESFPTQSGQAADMILYQEHDSWPWAVWTDGEKIVLTATSKSKVLVWNEFPTENNTPTDITIELEDFGTPRSIGSDGKHLAIGDHNAFGNKQGTFFWSSFPDSDNEDYDFYQDGDVLWGFAFLDDGRFLGFGVKLYIWDAFPSGEYDLAELEVGITGPGQEGYWFKTGHASTLALVGDRLYMSMSNGNKIVVYNSLPTQSTDEPDFAIGAPDIDTNTLETNTFITNPQPATNGEVLLVSSDFDKKLYIWDDLPDESGALPDYIYDDVGGWANALYEDTFVVVGQAGVQIWHDLPLNGEPADLNFSDGIGNVDFQGLKGVALDERYFYLSDYDAGKVYVWDGIPQADTNPLFSLEVDNPWRLSSDGEYLAVTDIYNHRINIYEIDELSADSEPQTVGGVGVFNLPESALVYDGHLFVADTGFHRVHVWKDIEDALAGEQADVLLGEDDFEDRTPEIGQDKTFWPAGLAFDGEYLWLGEYKFSGRLLRFSEI